MSIGENRSYNKKEVLMKKYYQESIGNDISKQASKLRKNMRSQSHDLMNSDFGIAGNTFRAFIGYSTAPSLVYRSWARETTERIISEKGVKPGKSQAEFDKWHNQLFDSLVEQWDSIQNNPLSFAHTFKLVDLYCRWLFTYDACPKLLAKSILSYGYCALDSQILRRLNEALSGALPIRKPTMGDIQNKNTYSFCQDLIKDFSEHYGVNRILFDFYAWKAGG
jgi:hypothetical protein